ncbi:MAG: HAMP domain-containing sensor histidine kinase [Acidobacteriota bacterium]
MPYDTDAPTPEREQTDESLRTERGNIDRERFRRQAAGEESVDRVVHRAREQADAVLDAAREKADHQEAGVPGTMAASKVSGERVVEDEALRRARATEDEVLRLDRQLRARALSTFLAIERERTDFDLLTERSFSDDALANRDDFLGMVSHDLRSLLNGIVIRVRLLAMENPEGERGERIRQETDRIQSYAARMTRLIGDLVDVVSIDAGKLAVAPVRQDCRALIDETMATFLPIAAGKNISLTKTEPPPLVADFDSERLLQVLANLIGNSIKFTAPGGSVSVAVERKGEEIRFSVRDTGSGIPTRMLENIFERFWQVGKNDQRGLGLGLYISRWIVEAHGGRIWAESEEGRGSRFFFTIPLHARVR